MKHGLHEADMPEPEALRAKLHGFDFSEFPILTPAILRQLNNVIDVDVHKVLYVAMLGPPIYCCPLCATMFLEFRWT